MSTATYATSRKCTRESAPASARPLNIFVVDEEDPITHLLSVALGMEGWSVSRLATGSELVATIRAEAPDAILLDMMLPDMSGIDVVAEIRKSGNETPILFLTGRSSLDDRLAAYAVGADDYITKPFGLEDVVSRLTELFRKQGKLPSSVLSGRLVLDTESNEAWLDGRALMLAPMDFLVVEILAHAKDGRMNRHIIADLLADAGFRFITSADLMDIPAVTGAGPGGMRSGVLEVSDEDLVLLEAAR